ncbi:hypothetical protein JL722_13592 [Aureococcus anophagefferens]|nr:hypothetical protein JL722_13592 [Aureococcus anophagefferens]
MFYARWTRRDVRPRDAGGVVVVDASTVVEPGGEPLRVGGDGSRFRTSFSYRDSATTFAVGDCVIVCLEGPGPGEATNHARRRFYRSGGRRATATGPTSPGSSSPRRRARSVPRGGGAVADFLEEALAASRGDGRTLYVSGMPGTGKTATVREVVGDLRKSRDFDFVEINAMRLPQPAHAYAVLWEALGGEKRGAEAAARCLEKLFGAKGGRDGARPAVLLVDELDYMVTQRQDVLYNLFDWPSRAGANLCVVGIANTMDLPERLDPKVRSRLGGRRLTFPPYGREQVEAIVHQRLDRDDLRGAFSGQAVTMAARKVAAYSGDIRALQICAKATGVCADRRAGGDGGDEVSIADVNAAHRALTASAYLAAVEHAAPLGGSCSSRSARWPRLGVVTGETLAKCVKRAYGPRVSLLLYGAAELAIVGSDVQEVLGTATGLRILFGLPLWAGCVVTAIDTCTFFLVQRLGWRALEAAIGALVVTLAVAFIGVWAAAPSEPGPLLYGLAVPTMRPSMLTQAVGTASTTAATIAGQYVMEGFFDWDVARWKRVALSRFLALGPAVLVAVSPMGQRNSFNEMLNVLQSACLPFAMLPLLHLARDERLMGRFANGPRLNRVVTTASVVVLAVNLILVYQYALVDVFDRPPAYAAGVSLATIAYLYAVSLAFRPRAAPEAREDDDAVAAFLRQEIELRAKGRVPKHGLATPVDPTEQVCCCGKNPDATRDLV